MDSLVETSAQQEAKVFTPYLLPDAPSLCTGLHLVRKLIASEKFIVIIAKSGKWKLSVTYCKILPINTACFLLQQHHCVIMCLCPSVIDSLDSMKKGRENYAAREAIKFLERSLQGGGRMVRVQRAKETLQPPGTRKPPKMDLNTWSAFCSVPVWHSCSGCAD